jgi:chromate reductase
VAVVGASTGLFGAVWAQAETRKVLTAAGARPLDRELPVGQASGAFDLDGRLADPDIAGELDGILAELVAAAGERELARA